MAPAKTGRATAKGLSFASLLALTAANGVPKCNQSTGSMLEQMFKTFKDGELGFAVHTEKATSVNDLKLHAYCYPVVNGTTRRMVVSEFSMTMIAVKTMWPSFLEKPQGELWVERDQDGFGGVDLRLEEFNGKTIDYGKQTNTGIEIQQEGGRGRCSDGDIDYYDGTVRIKQDLKNIQAGAAITTYMFKNDAEKNLSAKDQIKYTMDVDVGGCTLQVVYDLPPMKGGGLSAKVRSVIGAGWLGDAKEQELNKNIRFVMDDVKQIVSVFAPGQLLCEAAGQRRNCSGVSWYAKELLSFSKRFVCAKTGEVVLATMTPSEDPTDPYMMATLNATQAPESCGTMNWDPLVKPLGMDPSYNPQGTNTINNAFRVGGGVSFAWMLVTMGIFWSSFE
eukprot:TRINITY_DN27882_c0_g1_i1.p1 TRINITY_DN27882_c0_g1~~TRINITY_DN27882_c0_g1_i1.p1  ORF type:complete len:391 (+),score=96.53 TRINITY_DN27882_c0_g1_i1:44-1216(+)